MLVRVRRDVEGVGGGRGRRDGRHGDVGGEWRPCAPWSVRGAGGERGGDGGIGRFVAGDGWEDGCRGCRVVVVWVGRGRRYAVLVRLDGTATGGSNG